MLVLSRKSDEEIMIGDDIRITVVAVEGTKVRLGIAAPREIPVHRSEVHDAIQREMSVAASAVSVATNSGPGQATQE